MMQLHIDRQKHNTFNVSTCQLYTKALTIDYLFILLFSFIIIIRNSCDVVLGWLQDATSCRQIDRSKKNASNCSSRIIFSRNGNFWWAKKTKTVVAAVRRRCWSWWFVFLPFIHPQFLISVLEFQAQIHVPNPGPGKWSVPGVPWVPRVLWVLGVTLFGRSVNSLPTTLLLAFQIVPPSAMCVYQQVHGCRLM